ncbi:MAG: flavodoxin family protein [Planctomycetes bacterium]|nr:flavodoxin family protein [Planctomycetota bacterium]
MKGSVTRRNFLGIAGTAAVAAATASAQASNNAPNAKAVRILGVSCSPRKGETTATAVKVALDGAKEVDPRIAVELIDLGGKDIAGWSGGAKPSEGQELMDDFQLILPLLKAPDLGGIIIGSPSYFRTMSALCKAFLECCAVLRKPKLLLADKAVGVLSVGAYRNGGQELVIEQIQAAMLCHEVIIVGGKPGAHQGATLWNAYNDDITKDEFGMDTTRKLGIRVAEAALRLAQKQA